jgi:hypothetical protein
MKANTLIALMIRPLVEDLEARMLDEKIQISLHLRGADLQEKALHGLQGSFLADAGIQPHGLDRLRSVWCPRTYDHVPILYFIIDNILLASLYSLYTSKKTSAHVIIINNKGGECHDEEDQV